MDVEVSVEVNQKGCRLAAFKLLILLMRPARLERATFWFVAKRSIQLSYGRVRGTGILPSL
jgi:hypothetical protein